MLEVHVERSLRVRVPPRAPALMVEEAHDSRGLFLFLLLGAILQTSSHPEALALPSQSGGQAWIRAGRVARRVA